MLLKQTSWVDSKPPLKVFGQPIAPLSKGCRVGVLKRRVLVERIIGPKERPYLPPQIVYLGNGGAREIICPEGKASTSKK
jgi:hypothetical protein